MPSCHLRTLAVARMSAGIAPDRHLHPPRHAARSSVLPGWENLRNGCHAGWARAERACAHLQSGELRLQGCVELLRVPHAGLKACQECSQLALSLVPRLGQAAAWVCLLAVS